MNTIEEEIEKYLNGEMTQEESSIFLKKIDTDPEAKKSLKLYQEMYTIYNDNTWEVSDQNTRTKKIAQYENFLKSDKGKEIINTIQNVEQSYHEKQSSLKVKRFFLYAGVIAAIFIFGVFIASLFNKNPDNDQLYATYKNWNTLPSLTQRNEEFELSKIEELFNAQNYKESLKLLTKYTQENGQKTNPQVILYIGAAQLELDQNKAAISTFTQLRNSNTLDAPKAHWYLALCYLKLNELEKTKSELKLLINSASNFQKSDARKILKILQEK